MTRASKCDLRATWEQDTAPVPAPPGWVQWASVGRTWAAIFWKLRGWFSDASRTQALPEGCSCACGALTGSLRPGGLSHLVHFSGRVAGHPAHCGGWGGGAWVSPRMDPLRRTRLFPCCRQCALAALRDVKSYLTKEGGQIAVSLGNKSCLPSCRGTVPWREGHVDGAMGGRCWRGQASGLSREGSRGCR